MKIVRQKSFLTKLTIFALLLSTLPVLFIGVFSYITSSREVQNQVNRGKMQLLMQTNANVEQILLTVNHTLNQVVHSTVLKKVMNEPITVNDFMMYNDLRMEIRHMQSFDTKVEEVVLLNRKHNWMIKNSGVYALDAYFHSDELVRLLDEEDDSFWTLNPSSWFYSEEEANHVVCDYVVSLVKKMPVHGMDKYGLAMANIPVCSLGDFLQVDSEDASHVIVLDDRYRILQHPHREWIGKPLEETGFLERGAFTASSGQFDAAIERKQHAVNYLRSDLNDWTYVSLIPIESLTKESKKIGMYTLYVCLIVLLMLILLAWGGSRRMYTPIQKTLQQLFQSKTELEQEVRQHIQQVGAFFLFRAYQGSVRPNEIEEGMRQFGFAGHLVNWQTMSVITVQIDTLDHTHYDKRDTELLLFAIQNMLGELIPADQGLPPIVIERTVVCLIGSSNEQSGTFNNIVYTLTEHLQKEIQKYLKLQVSIGISLPFDDVIHISSAYAQGLEALKQRIKLGEGVIIQYENVNFGKHYLNLQYPSHIENDLIEALKLADVDKTRELMGEFMRAVIAMELSPQEYQTPFFRLLNQLFIVMQEAGISINQVQPANHSLFEDLLKLHIASDIEEWFWKSVIEPTIHIFRDRQDAQYQNISEKIIDLIQRYYDTGITLEECAEKLHYNANYLSSVFRKETNCSFSEYLTAYRFSMAKKWLAETDTPIKDIAARLRYNNSQNFIRSFRKLEGITPGQYREKYARSSGA